MSLKSFSELWLFFVLLPYSSLWLIWLLRLRYQKARELNVNFWSFKVIRFSKEVEPKLKLGAISMMTVAAIFLISEFLSRQ